MTGRWLPGPDPGPDAEVRLFCLPYAGGGAGAFRGWARLAPPHVAVCPVELPGRGTRLAEPAHRRLSLLVRALAAGLAPALDRPYALFGHSLGALLACELTRVFAADGRPPVHLFVSGAAAPAVPRTRPAVHAAPDEDVLAELRSLNGTPPELLADEELMGLMLPTLRADFAVLETYEHRPGPPLPVPITAFGGSADPAVPPAALTGWRRESAVGARVHVLPGDHFFLHDAAAEVAAAVAGALGPARAALR